MRLINKSFFAEIFAFTLFFVIIATSPLLAKGTKNYRVKVLEVLSHSVDSYTQGLFFHNNQLYESVGEYKQSAFKKVDLKTGSILKSFKFTDEFFAEGSVVLKNKLYILTWRENVCFVYDINTLKPITTIYNPREGWGLTTNGEQLIASDGSWNIYFLDPTTFKELSKIVVRLDGKRIDMINELEYINGEIWANVYQTDKILIINPKTGIVRATVDCTNLLSNSLKTQYTDVLNGIAYNPVTKAIYLTGKRWPKMFRIELKD